MKKRGVLSVLAGIGIVAVIAFAVRQRTGGVERAGDAAMQRGGAAGVENTVGGANEQSESARAGRSAIERGSAEFSVEPARSVSLGPINAESFSRLLAEFNYAGVDAEGLATMVKLLENAGDPQEYAKNFGYPGCVQDLDKLIEPGNVLGVARAAAAAGFTTEFSNVLAAKLRATKELDPRVHAELSVATALAVEIIARDTSLSVTDRSTIATSTLQFAFAANPDVWVALLERVPGMVGQPAEPSAAYALSYRMLMDAYAERGNAEGFEFAARRWNETDWRQGEAGYREWREGVIERVRRSMVGR